MSVLVGSARIDENGKASGGAAGDQTGNEVSTQAWYSKPWDFMAIHPDADIREKHASLVEAACANNQIGYDQNQRNTLHTQAKANSYNIKGITTACECDCSSLQHVCAIGSGGMAESTYGSNGMTTSTMKSKLKSAGYIIIEDSAYLKSVDYCVRGAIYVKSGSHTVCGLGNGSKYKDTLAKAGIGTSDDDNADSGTPSSTYKAGDKVTLKSAKLYASSTAKSNSGTKTGTFYIWSGNVLNGRIRITNTSANVGKSGKVTGWVNESDISASSSGTTASTTAKTTAPTYKVGSTYTLQVELKVRKGAGTNYAAKKYSELTANGKKNDKDGDGALDKGTKVTCQELKTVGSDIWMRVPSGWIAAYYEGNIYVK